MTGYTCQLKELNWNFKKWMIESVSRHFGFTIMFREDGVMDETAMRAGLTEDVLEAKVKLENLLANPPKSFEDCRAELEVEAIERNKSNKISNPKYIEEHSEIAAGLKSSLESARKYGESVVGTKLENIANFATQQIWESLKFHGEKPYQSTSLDPITEEDLREGYDCKVESHARSVKYAEQSLDSAKKGLDFFEAYVKSLNAIA